MAPKLIESYRRVKPFGPGWKQIREEAGITESAAKATHENIPLALLGWTVGCVLVGSALFTIGNFIYGRVGMGLTLLAVATISGSVLIAIVNKLWDEQDQLKWSTIKQQ